nr:hypothetical protein [Gelidibacter salicanalis]
MHLILQASRWVALHAKCALAIGSWSIARNHRKLLENEGGAF